MADTSASDAAVVGGNDENTPPVPAQSKSAANKPAGKADASGTEGKAGAEGSAPGAQAPAPTSSGSRAAPVAAKKQAPPRPYKFAILRKGNNPQPVMRALARRPYWAAHSDAVNGTAIGCQSCAGLNADGTIIWPVQFVWKFLIHPIPRPPANYLRGDINPWRRQITNRMFHYTRLIIHKNTLCRTMVRYYKETGRDPFAEALPLTFVVVPVPCEDPETWEGWTEAQEAIAAGAAQAEKEVSAATAAVADDDDDGGAARSEGGEGAKPSHNMWLVKPTSSNRGRGIEICYSEEEVFNVINPGRRKPISTRAPAEWIVQRYIKNPLLYKGRKFDIRVWVLWTDINHGSVYVFDQGYVRTSSDAYDLDGTDKSVHLTNFCLQKSSESFGAHEAGNTVSFAELGRFIARQRGDTSGATPQLDSIQRQIKAIVCDTAGALDSMARAGLIKPEPVRQSIKSRVLKRAAAQAEKGAPPIPITARQHQFELLGYDFMVDEDMKVWLLEANLNPAVMYQNEWHETMVDSMMEDIFRIAVDPVFPPPRWYRAAKKAEEEEEAKTTSSAAGNDADPASSKDEEDASGKDEEDDCGAVDTSGAGSDASASAGDDGDAAAAAAADSKPLPPAANPKFELVFEFSAEAAEGITASLLGPAAADAATTPTTA